MTLHKVEILDVSHTRVDRVLILNGLKNGPAADRATGIHTVPVARAVLVSKRGLVIIGQDGSIAVARASNVLLLDVSGINRDAHGAESALELVLGAVLGVQVNFELNTTVGLMHIIVPEHDAVVSCLGRVLLINYVIGGNAAAFAVLPKLGASTEILVRAAGMAVVIDQRTKNRGSLAVVSGRLGKRGNSKEGEKHF